MAGVKSALRGKVEDKINMELAKAFIQATGGSPDQVDAITQAMSFMRGKVQERKIKSIRSMKPSCFRFIFMI
jgi:hypothetical protein